MHWRWNVSHKKYIEIYNYFEENFVITQIFIVRYRKRFSKQKFIKRLLTKLIMLYIQKEKNHIL